MRALRLAFAILWGIGLGTLHAQDNAGPPAPDVLVPKAWSLLTTSLKAADLQEQLAAVRALTIADTPSARSLLESVARTGTEPVRNTAIWYVPSSSPPSSTTTRSSHDYFPLVAGALQDPDLSVRKTAIGRLAAFHDDVHDVRALALLHDVLARADADTIESAVGTLRNFGSSGFSVLLSAVESGNDNVVEASLTTIDVLVDPSLSSRAPDNVVALRQHRPNVLLTRALRHSSSEVRIYAALILARLGSDGGVGELTRAAQARDQKVGTIRSAYCAMAALNALGRSRYRPSLSAAVANADPRVRAAIAFALTSFPHSSTIPLWAKAWQQGASDIRYWAFRGLMKAEGVPNRRLLQEGLTDTDPYIRLTAAEEILALGFDAQALDVAEGLLAVPATRPRALNILERRADPRRTGTLALQLLPKALEDDARMRGSHYDPGDRLLVVHALEVTQNREAVPALGALFGEDPNVNYRVVQALIAIGDDAAGQALVNAMEGPHGPARALAAGGVLRLYSR